MLNLMSFSPSNFSRYVSQTEQPNDETSGTNEWTQQPSTSTSTSTTTTTTITDIPSLMSVPTITTPPPPPSPITSTNIPQKITIPSTIIKEDVEPFPFPQHGPGPIQRPNKLTCLPTQQSTTTTSAAAYLTNSIQSPETPDVLDQINRLLDHQNSTTTMIPPTPNVNNSSVPINDLTTPSIPWTTFPPTEWSSKYDSSWPLTSIQSPTVSLTTQVPNPFALMSTINEQQQQQRQSTREDSSIWSSLLGTATPRSLSSSTRTQRASTWNDLFSSTVPSSTESTKPTNNSWLKFLSAPDPSSADGTLPNGNETETNNPFWNLSTLSNESVVSSTMPNQQQVSASASAWWPNSSSDENNNKSQTNHLNDNITNSRGHSRWDFAR